MSGWLFAPAMAGAGSLAFVVSLALFGLASVAIVTEPRALVRGALFAMASGAFALVLFVDDGWWLHDVAYQKLALLTIGEAVVLLLFLETRLWRLSWVPGLLAAAAYVMYVLSPVSWVLAGKRMAWLAFAMMMLVVNVARRAMREEDEAVSRSASPDEPSR